MALLGPITRRPSMPQTRRLQRNVRQSIAEKAAHALAVIERPVAAAEVRSRTTLHESLPVWLITSREFDRIRSGKVKSPENIRDCMLATSMWLHLLYRNGTPYGCVHSDERPKGHHKVTNVSVTREAELIQRAIDEVDRVADETVCAGICECSKVGIAGIIVLPKKRRDQPMVCIFRDPEAKRPWAPSAPITARAFIERLRRLHVVTGPLRKAAVLHPLVTQTQPTVRRRVRQSPRRSRTAK